MTAWFSKWLSIALLCCTTACSAYSGIKDAVVIEKDGVPCFSAEPNEALSRLHAIVVWDESSTKPPPVMWATDAQPQSTCIKYGQKFASEKIAQEAWPLQPGHTYKVFLNAPPTDPTSPYRGYQALFCLVKSSGAINRVYQVRWDEKNGRWNDDACK